VIATKPLRHIAEVRVSNVDKKTGDGEQPVRLCNYTDVYYNDRIYRDLDFMTATATSAQIARFVLQVGDTVITKDSETADDIAVSAYVTESAPDVVCGYHLAILRPRENEIKSRYLSWAIQSDYCRSQFTIAATGVTRFGLKHDAIRGVGIPTPTIDVQRRIADFLDDQVARIDAAIRLREQQVQTLTTRLGAFAHAAVAGANFQDRKKTSLDWSEELPSHWRVARLATIAQIGTGHTPSRSEPEYWQDCDIPWLTTTDVKHLRADEVETLTDTEVHISKIGLENSAAVMHPAGTVGLCRTSASAGYSAIMRVPMATSQDFAVWRPSPMILPRYLLWCLRAMRTDLLERLAMGSTHKTIYFPDLLSIRVPLPPLDEQESIVESIGREIPAIVEARREMRAQISLLQERKSSLVTAAVTGEFDTSTAAGRGVL
jgi:type I restriction enzyme, S subunit